jgi:hypothetical protein
MSRHAQNSGEADGATGLSKYKLVMKNGRQRIWRFAISECLKRFQIAQKHWFKPARISY